MSRTFKTAGVEACFIRLQCFDAELREDMKVGRVLVSPEVEKFLAEQGLNAAERTLLFSSLSFLSDSMV